jgi:2-octaprenylphenol hydroxylase
MQKFDVIIVGGGMVGLTTALAIRKQSDLTVAVIDTAAPTALSVEPETRVSAINLASQHIFENLNVWPAIQQMRLKAYQQMHVWDKQGFASLNFDQQSVNQAQLGWIIENNVIRQALWQQVEKTAGITLVTDKLSSIAEGDTEVFASFENHPPIIAKLVIGADGANSWLRQQMKMPIIFRDYDHHALVATVHCPQGHQNTAWQVFLPEGPLAFLPLYDDHLCSIVWSTSPAQAKQLLTTDITEFNKQITAASDGKLGAISLQSERGCFPLTMRLVHEFNQSRLILIGDAAHTIHPLAGQGVNLGLLDASCLAQTIAELANSQKDIAHTPTLNKFSRYRKTQAAEMIAAMELIKQTFAIKPKPLQLLRGFGMSLLDNISPIKQILVKQAIGDIANLPKLAQVSESLE